MENGKFMSVACIEYESMQKELQELRKFKEMNFNMQGSLCETINRKITENEALKKQNKEYMSRMVAIKEYLDNNLNSISDIIDGFKDEEIEIEEEDEHEHEHNIT